MPIYEFHCKDCGRDSELLVPSTKWQGTKCPHCGSENLEKLFSSFVTRTGSATGGSYRSGGGSGCASCSGGSCSTCR